MDDRDNLAPAPAEECELGRLLRLWRAQRGLSQMDLAIAADVSTRHISFIENGRSRATVEMVLRLADVLGAPLRDRNTLLAAAGFAPLYREIGLQSPEREQIYTALRTFLKNQDPFMANVIDRRFNIVLSNESADRRFAMMFDTKKLWGDGPRNVVRMFLHDDGLKPLVEDWPRIAQWALEQVYRQAHEGIGDPETLRLFEEYLDYPGVRDLWRVPAPDYVYPPVLHMTLRKFGLRLSNFFMMTTFGTSQDAYLQELRIICGYPANETARRFALWLARTRGKRALSEFK
jgi:transcriptional regulator with XRE-family HTH domain